MQSLLFVCFIACSIDRLLVLCLCLLVSLFVSLFVWLIVSFVLVVLEDCSWLGCCPGLHLKRCLPGRLCLLFGYVYLCQCVWLCAWLCTLWLTVSAVLVWFACWLGCFWLICSFVNSIECLFVSGLQSDVYYYGLLLGVLKGLWVVSRLATDRCLLFVFCLLCIMFVL